LLQIAARVLYLHQNLKHKPMKKLITLSFLIINSAFCIYAQSNAELFNSSKMVWYGMDFSRSKLVGSEGFSDPYDIQKSYIPGWNNLILSEAEKYNIRKFFKKGEVVNDISAVEPVNEKINPSEWVQTTAYTLDKSEIAGMVKKYKSTEKEGLGVVFIIESFDKFKESGFMYVTFFNIATKEVILTEKLSGKAGGFGLKSYWAKTIFLVLEQCEKKMGSWKKQVEG